MACWLKIIAAFGRCISRTSVERMPLVEDSSFTYDHLRLLRHLTGLCPIWGLNSRGQGEEKLRTVMWFRLCPDTATVPGNNALCDS